MLYSTNPMALVLRQHKLVVVNMWIRNRLALQMSAALFSVQFSIVLGCIATTTNGFCTINYVRNSYLQIQNSLLKKWLASVIVRSKLQF